MSGLKSRFEMENNVEVKKMEMFLHRGAKTFTRVHRPHLEATVEVKLSFFEPMPAHGVGCWWMLASHLSWLVWSGRISIRAFQLRLKRYRMTALDPFRIFCSGFHRAVLRPPSSVILHPSSFVELGYIRDCVAPLPHDSSDIWAVPLD